MALWKQINTGRLEYEEVVEKMREMDVRIRDSGIAGC